MAIIDEIVDDFFNEDLAVNAIYTNNIGQPSDVSVILDRQYIEAEQFGDVSQETREVFITVKTSDFEDCEQGETVEVDGTEYYIINPQMDIGVSRIKLSLDDPYES